ncbi:hypothetical protein GCM10010201_24900 [Pilimelia columellifera subsp. columellifera]|uniref:Tn3 transposase DDE domain-containing protein n=1 Tax=Pilimelia columellifera subsp. columellifera TaxID=706583 RepID=A0ABN3NQ97_9ACTN
MWDDLLPCGGLRQGRPRHRRPGRGESRSTRRQQNTLAAAIKEHEALRRTLYAGRYLADETYRRRIARQLNKGESLHALRRPC